MLKMPFVLRSPAIDSPTYLFDLNAVYFYGHAIPRPYIFMRPFCAHILRRVRQRNVEKDNSPTNDCHYDIPAM